MKSKTTILLSILPLVFGYLILIGVSNSDGMEAFKKSEQKTATCSLKGFKGFPENVTGPVTLELAKLITVMVSNDDESLEITVAKKRCEIK